MIAENVPEKAITWKIGVTRAGTKAEGSRRMLRRLRRAMPPTAGTVPVAAAARGARQVCVVWIIVQRLEC